MNNYTINIKNNQDLNIDQLIISGELSFNYIDAIYNDISSLLKKNIPEEIIIENPDILDLSFIQILLSIKKEFQSKIILNLNEELTDLIKVAGFYKSLTDNKL